VSTEAQATVTILLLVLFLGAGSILAIRLRTWSWCLRKCLLRERSPIWVAQSLASQEHQAQEFGSRQRFHSRLVRPHTHRRSSFSNILDEAFWSLTTHRIPQRWRRSGVRWLRRPRSSLLVRRSCSF